MIYLIIYLVFVFITFVYSIYRLNLKAKLMFENGYEGTRYYFFGILVSDPWWMIILNSFWIAPIFIPMWVLSICRNRYYRNRPRPTGRNLRHFIKLDRVLDENGNLVTLAEYNQKHNTNFTPEQVYGKRFVKKAMAQEQKEAEGREKAAEKEILARAQSQSISKEDFDGPPF